MVLNCHAKKVMKGAEVFHGKFLHQSINDPAEELLRRGSEDNIVHIEQRINSTSMVNKQRSI